MSELLTWGLPITVGLALFGLSYSLLQTASSSADYWIARVWFVVGSVTILARVLFWSLTSSGSISWRTFSSLLVLGMLIAVTVATFRSIAQKQAHSRSGPEKKVDPKKTAEIIRSLSTLAEEGNTLLLQNKEKVDADWERARDWFYRSDEYVRTTLGDEDAEYLALATTQPYPGLAVDRRFVDTVHTRRQRLGEIAVQVRNLRVAPQPAKLTQGNEPPREIPKPVFRVRAPPLFPGVVQLDVNVFKKTSDSNAIFPVLVSFENLPQFGFTENQDVWALVRYVDSGFGEIARVNAGCWVEEPLPDITFPYHKTRILLLGGWHINQKDPVKNEFRTFEYSRQLHRPIEQSEKIQAPRKLDVIVTLTPNGFHDSSVEYKFELRLFGPSGFSIGEARS